MEKLYIITISFITSAETPMEAAENFKADLNETTSFEVVEVDSNHQPIGEPVTVELDLFAHYELLPAIVQSILADYEDNELEYWQCEQLLAKLERQGYTFEYGLGGTPYNLRKIKS